MQFKFSTAVDRQARHEREIEDEKRITQISRTGVSLGSPEGGNGLRCNTRCKVSFIAKLWHSNSITGVRVLFLYPDSST